MRRSPPTARRTPFDRWDALLLALAAAIVCWSHLHPFIGDARPTHFDEWRNAGRIRALLETGRLDLPRPTTGLDDLDEDLAHRNLQAGYVVVATTVFKFSRLDPVEHHKVLALAGLLVLIGGVYLLARVLAPGRLGPPLTVLLLVPLPTNVNLLGPAYAVPYVPSLGLVCLFLAAWLAGDRWSPIGRAVALLGTGLALAVTYPLSGAFLCGLIGLAVLARPAALLEPPRAVAWGALAALLALAAWFGGGHSLAGQMAPGRSLVPWAVEQFVFLDRWHLHRFYHFPLGYLVPPALLAAALAGCWLAWRRRAEVVGLGLLLPLLAYAGYGALGYGFGLPYQRLGLFLGVFAVVLGALAGAELIAWCRSRLPSWAAATIGAAFLALVAVSRVEPPGIESLRHLRRPSPAVVESLRWIERRGYEPATRVHGHPAVAPFVQPLTGLRPTEASIDALLNGRGLAVFRCDERYDLVVGLITCDSYRAVFVSRGVAVWEPVSR